MRNLSLADRLIDELQHGLNTSHSRPAAAARDFPARQIRDDELDAEANAHSAGLMRVNNAGEVAAQGLYRGQALGARAEALSSAMQEAADEENEHLNWCQRRLEELNQRAQFARWRLVLGIIFHRCPGRRGRRQVEPGIRQGNRAAGLCSSRATSATIACWR